MLLFGQRFPNLHQFLTGSTIQKLRIILKMRSKFIEFSLYISKLVKYLITFCLEMLICVYAGTISTQFSHQKPRKVILHKCCLTHYLPSNPSTVFQLYQPSLVTLSSPFIRTSVIAPPLSIQSMVLHQSILHRAERGSKSSYSLPRLK